MSLGSAAIEVCFGCPVRKECKEYRKRTNSQHGIWAGEWHSRGSS